jgi:hypothetical protein
MVENKKFKKLPSNLDKKKTFSPLAFAFLIKGDGS